MDTRKLVIAKKEELKPGIIRMTLSGNCSDIAGPGQFINIKLDGFYLRRPISISSYTENSLTIIFKIVGHGTDALSDYHEGKELDVLMPLGNGYSIRESHRKPLLVGGGIGVPPLYSLADAMVKKGITPQIVLGFNTAGDLILEEEFKSLGLTPQICTVDGSAGTKGMVTDLMKNMEFDYVYTCGPEPMLKAVWNMAPDGQFSFEARMACGFGACMGCTCETKYGYKRICKDGPVLEKEEIIW